MHLYTTKRFRSTQKRIGKQKTGERCLSLISNNNNTKCLAVVRRSSLLSALQAKDTSALPIMLGMWLPLLPVAWVSLLKNKSSVKPMRIITKSHFTLWNWLCPFVCANHPWSSASLLKTSELASPMRLICTNSGALCSVTQVCLLPTPMLSAKQFKSDFFRIPAFERTWVETNICFSKSCSSRGKWLNVNTD